MQVVKWGDSLAVRLPAYIIDALDLRAGDDIEFQIVDGRTFHVSKRANMDKLLAHLRHYRGRLPDGFRFDRLETQERSENV